MVKPWERFRRKGFTGGAPVCLLCLPAYQFLQAPLKQLLEKQHLKWYENSTQKEEKYKSLLPTS